MRERSELILADVVQIRAEQKPDLDVLTFEHLSLDGGETPDEVRTYAATSEQRQSASPPSCCAGASPAASASH